MVGMLLPLTATAADLKADLTIYYDVSDFGDFSGNKLQLMVGHDSYSIAYEMKAVEGYDNLYSVNIGDVNSGNSWGGANQLGIMAATSVWGSENSSPTHRFSYTSLKTGIYKLTKNLSGNVLFTGKSTLSITENYTLPVKDPVINVGTLSQFPATTVNETSTATLTYKVENSDETAKVTVEGEGFTAEDVAGTITITFAPTEAKEYTATLTIAIGDIKETVDLVATGVAADAPKVPEILNLAAGEIAEIFAGETTEFEVTYTLLNAEEATASIEGEGFTIKKQEVGTATIEFAPTEAKTYEAVVTVTSGETIKTLEISATAKKVPVVITISFVNPDWTEAAIWAWIDGGENLTGGEWPGKAMTKGENGKFTYDLTLPENGTYNFIINNNGNGLQSVDMAGVTESTCYNLGAKSGEKYNLVVAENCDYTPAPEPEPIDPYVAIRGTMTDWTMANDIKMTYNAEAANGPEWYITAFEVPADGKFKVVSVDDKSQTTWYGSDKVDLQEGITNDGKGDEDIALPAGKYDIYFKVNEGRMWIQKYVAPEEPEKPELNVSAEEVVFDELTLGEEPVSATETIKYEIKNSDEAAVIELESDVFKAEDENGTITITFAPEAEGEYTAELTITLGEIVKTIAISGSAKAAEVSKPELIVSTEELVFETLILDGEQFSSTETITYEIKNSDEAAVIALESDVFKAEDENGTITITFTPIFNNYLYKAELTITLGDIVKTVAISAVVKPLIDDILLPEFDDTKVGEYDEIEVLYSLHKGNEGVARIEGDPAFEITSQEVGRMFIKFTPLEVKEYTATLIITSGKFEREITLIANGIAPDPEPTDITFTVQVPEGTKECWIAGTPGWTFIQMEKVDGEENLFSITVEKTVLNGEQWKYASGANWQYAEVIEGNGNRTEAEDPYDVVTAWQKLYDPDFQPIDPYYAIRGLNGDASWTGSGDIKLEENSDASEWVALGFTVAEGESFKVIYIDENADVSGYYAGLEDGCDVGQSYDDMGNLVLPAGTYNLYFKPDTELMWISKVDTPTDAEEAIAELIYAVDGTIFAPAPFAIIDLAGKDVTKANGSLQGTYIVKTLNSTAKISVK